MIWIDLSACLQLLKRSRPSLQNSKFLISSLIINIKVTPSKLIWSIMMTLHKSKTLNTISGTTGKLSIQKGKWVHWMKYRPTSNINISIPDMQSENLSLKSFIKLPNLNLIPTVSSISHSTTTIMFLLQNSKMWKFNQHQSNLKKKILRKLPKFTLCHLRQNKKSIKTILNQLSQKIYLLKWWKNWIC